MEGNISYFPVNTHCGSKMGGNSQTSLQSTRDPLTLKYHRSISTKSLDFIVQSCRAPSRTCATALLKKEILNIFFSECGNGEIGWVKLKLKFPCEAAQDHHPDRLVALLRQRGHFKEWGKLSLIADFYCDASFFRSPP